MTTTPVPLSCCIITKNEADRIGACIDAAKAVADEIVVVDSGSTDETTAIAERLGARVFFHEWQGYGPQKRFSEECASHDWILHLDADEVLTPELQSEIKALLQTTPPLKAYRFRITDVYPGKTQPRLWGDMYNNVRLYDRRAVRFSDSAVHDRVDTRDYEVGQLKGRALHFSMRSYAHLKQKLNAYAAYQAKMMKKPAWVIWLRLPFEYPFAFVRNFLLRRHFTGGLDGLRVSHLAAQARFNRLRWMLEAAADGARSPKPGS